MTDSSAYASLTAAAREAPPQAALILGSGMGRLSDRLRVAVRVPFGEVPGLTPTGVAGHRGELALGDWAGRRVLVFEGRLHHYEGHTWQSVVEPVRVAHALGARNLVLTNAAGGIHDSLEPGSLMLLRDHIEWTWPYCWRRPGPGARGGEQPSPYCGELQEAFLQAAGQLGIELLPGVYAAVTGPCYETPAEIRALKASGADAVGMSTAREVQQGYDLGLRCSALSCITNRAAGLSGSPLHHDEVLATARAQGERLTVLIERFLQSIRP